ncbi:MAG: zinc-dependent alcohol dehydrogenase family protein [Rhodospirillaceae bacterium]|nr:zinc-dependent alcohol dehydrogenase family protein [Rhodospirillaceae bacterium]
MKRIVYDAFGEPARVLRIDEGAALTPGPDEVVIGLEAAPIHLADLKGITGQPWFTNVSFPAVPGYEGVGHIKAVGSAVGGVKIGQRVFLPVGYGAWTEEMRALAADLWFPPQHISAEQLALIPINLPTAYLMLTTYIAPRIGDWVIQNAANSNVGYYLIRIARKLGLRTVNIVRRESAVPEVEALGGDITLVDGPDLAARVRHAIGNERLRLAIDAVGGSATTRLAECLDNDDAKVVCYGFLSGQPCEMPGERLIFRDVELTGFFMKRTLSKFTRTQIADMRTWINAFLADEPPNAKIAGVYTFDQIAAAVTHAAQVKEARAGKIILKP